MSQSSSKLRRLFTVGYAPNLEDKSFLERAQQQTSDGLDVNLTGDPYITDGKRAVLILSRAVTDAAYLNWC
jgi:hypothetical protein